MPPGLRVVNTDDVGISGAGTTGVVGTGVQGGTDSPGGPGVGVSGSGSMGVIAQGDLFGVLAGGNSGPAVYGVGKDIAISGLAATGVMGVGATAGVHGWSTTDGVLGESTSSAGGSGGVRGVGGAFGVVGQGGPSIGFSGIGVIGFAGLTAQHGGVGVWGEADSAAGVGYGVIGNASDPSSLAVYSQGNCLVIGDFLVSGSKSAAVKLRNGEHRTLYCMESPDCWFEDFGRARLVRGKARVKLEPIFAQVTRTDDYHIFLSPEGLSHGLYVSRRNRNGFEVREQGDGKSTVAFSYRIVARRRDIKARRFKRVKLPPRLDAGRPPKAAVSRRPTLPDVPQPALTPQLKTLLSRAGGARPRRDKTGRRRSGAR